MAGILDLLSRVAEMRRVPRCSGCDLPTELVREETVPGTPPVLESVFRCHRCGTALVRCLVAGALD